MKLWFILSLTLFLTGCNYEVKDDVGSDRRFQEDVEQGTELGFDFILEEVISTSCFNCHRDSVRRAGLGLETYEEVFSRRQDIYDAVSSHFMPDSQGGSMTDERRALLLEWIEAGAPREPTAPESAFLSEQVGG